MSDLLAHLQTALADRFVIECEVGKGGNAVVYLAHDPKHGRKVAIKVLMPQIALAIGADRFLREIRIAARLRHPHILPLHDSGEAGGFLYYVMPFVDGESLRDRLLRHGPMPIDVVIRIASEVASALAYAHERGVVHRDIKPENILIDGGYAVVADFGIARAVNAAVDDAVTRTGISVGTPAYVSPEQAVGTATVDGRSDMYSLACVVYEMLVGHPPYQGESLFQLLKAHAMEDIPSIRHVRPEVPEKLDVAVTRALAKDSADRFPRIEQFAEALIHSHRSSAPMLAALDSGTTGGRLWNRVRSIFAPPRAAPRSPPIRSPIVELDTREQGGVATSTTPVTHPTPSAPLPLATPTRATTIDSLAVLPFANASGDPDGEYLSDGITESIINKMSQLSGLRVVPRSVVFRYKGRDVDPETVASEVHARALVVGRIHQRGDRLIIKAELVDVLNQSQLWGEQYSRPLSDIFDVQEEMAAEITRSLRHRLTGEEAKVLSKRDTESTAAYQSYLKGRYHWSKRTLEGLQQAIAHFQEAIELDPAYLLAYTGLADSYSILGYYNNSRPRDVYPRAKAAASRALERDDTLAEAHASLGYVSVFFDWDWPRAESEFRRALELGPNYATTHHWHAWYLFAMERFDEALRELQRAQELDPLSLIINDHLGYALLMAGRPDEALQQLIKTRELDPKFPWTYWRLGNVHFAQGRLDDAAAAYRQVVDMTSGVVGLGYLGLTHAAAGRADEARDVLERLEHLATQRFVSPLDFALVHAGLGDVAQTFAALARAVEERVSDMARVNLLPWPDAVREDPRFEALLRELRLRPLPADPRKVT
ncbi:MAG TPA: protein kinase [Gemmatimonadaceae bacterium]|nr:protein kinase [Gemmatimonadaceae bacterium]